MVEQPSKQSKNNSNNSNNQPKYIVYKFTAYTISNIGYKFINIAISMALAPTTLT